MIKAVTTQGVVELRLKPDDFAYSGAPMFHISGMGHMFYLLARGGSSLVLPQFDTNTVLSWMQDGGLTRCMLIPSMVISLLEHPDVRKSSYENIRAIMYGGAPIAPSVIREMIEIFGCDLFNGFGAGTEAGGQAMFNPEDHKRALAGEESLLGSIGKAIYGVDLKLMDADGNEVERGSVGEIHTRGDTVMSGYLNQPELTAASFNNGWFHAGDMAYVDESGYLHLEGRRDDMIIRGGENVYPVEIEDTISDHPSVLEVAVIGVADKHWGEIVAAVIVLRPGTTVDLETLRAHCVGRIASYKIPTQLEIVDVLPKNPTGKILKRQLRLSLALPAVES
jgi:acyl-CoA synthetase (AMP-forming)/AMP-acid ligase II